MKKRILSLLIVISFAFSLAPAAVAASSPAISSATSLFTLGLFKGTGVNQDGTPVYDLDRTPTRAEAVVMLVRLLGKETEAKSLRYGHSFTDVEDWASPYIGYAYAKGLSKGTSPSAFGSEDTISVSEFLTLVLRALGYSSGSDFKWDSAWTLSDSIGLTNGSYNAHSSFLRGDAAIISYNALSQKLKGSSKTLLSSLYESGTVTIESVKSVGLYSLLSAPSSELTADQIYAKCSPAVFYIAMYDASGRYIGQGSGFFIDSAGLAVTNFHVIKNAYSAKVKTTDGKIYNVLGVYSVDKVNDLALIKIDGSGFSYLETADSESLKIGSTVYAIGNPKGLESTISQGIISYLNRQIGDAKFIQTTAPISPGSSGGALIDTYGRVIGVTTGHRDGGQNLNIASPINNAKKLSRAAYTPLKDKSSYSRTEKAYPNYPEVPDFGAYLGVNIYAQDSWTKSGYNYVGYSYKSSEVYSASSKTITQYANLLEDWGLPYVNGDENTLMYGNGYTYVIITSGTADDGTVCIGVVIMTKADGSSTGSSGSSGSGTTAVSYPKTQTGYANNAAIPDFGAYFGVSVYKDLSAGNETVILYKKSDLTGKTSSSVTEYEKLLESWGYKYLSSSADYGNLYKKNGFKAVAGSYKYEGTDCIRISYYESVSPYGFCDSVPDFGEYFGVNMVYGYAGDKSASLAYYAYEAHNTDPNAFQTYCTLLGRWGFSYSSEYAPDENTYGHYYKKGSVLAYIGTYTKDGMTYYVLNLYY